MKFSLGWSQFKPPAHRLVIAAQIEQGGLPSWQAASHHHRQNGTLPTSKG